MLVKCLGFERIEGSSRMYVCKLTCWSFNVLKNSCVNLLVSMILRFGIACNFTLETSPHLLSWRFVILGIIWENIFVFS